ncbi:MAG TPA: hypothetical protein VGQ76_11055 [Thermoanaerobaculia bacterium]|nr:hypothetical protein [Thermoanaerobaculia bacterium]
MNGGLLRRVALTTSLLLLFSLSAFAATGGIDVAPAATLLVPYWEVDTNNAAGVDTLVTVQNASATAMIGRVTLWTDYGVPTDAFDVYLTGYDQETVSLRHVLNRLIPVTATDGQDVNDTISPQGRISQDINFQSCSGLLPGYERFLSSDLIQAHLGQPAPDLFGAGNCGGRNFGDGIARGYLTVDTVNQCNCAMTALNPGYFVNGGSGVATNQNIMLGEVTFVDAPNGRRFTEPAVHIEADPGKFGTPGEYTFYARFVGNSAADNREALPTAWVGKFAANRTDVEYWRDPGVPVSAFPCGGTPFTLDEQQVRALDENGGNVSAIFGNPFPRAAGVARGGTDLGLASGFGSLYLNLNLPAPSGPQGNIRQSWVTFRQIPRDQSANSPLGYASHGIQLGNANTGDDPQVP